MKQALWQNVCLKKKRYDQTNKTRHRLSIDQCLVYFCNVEKHLSRRSKRDSATAMVEEFHVFLEMQKGARQQIVGARISPTIPKIHR